MIATPLRMEKPVRRPIVPPISPSWASVVTLNQNQKKHIGQGVSNVTLCQKKNCDASTIPSRAYINHIQKNFFPRTSLEGRPTWSKIGHPAVSICRKNLFFDNNTTPVNSLRGSQERLQHFFCPNTLPFFATDTYKLVAQGSLFI